MTDILPPSPNWYCSKILDSSLKHDLVVYGARSDLVFLKVVLPSPDHTIKNDQSHKVQFKLIHMGSRIHRERVTAVKLLDNGGGLDVLTASEDGAMKCNFLNLGENCSVSLKPVSEHQPGFQGKEKLTCAELGLEGQFIAGTEKGNLVQWEWKTGLNYITLLVKSPVFCMSRLPEGQYVAAGMKSGAILLYDTTNHLVHTRLKGHDEEIQSLNWYDNSLDQGLVSSSRDKTVRMWNVETARCTATHKLSNAGGGASKSSRERIWISTVCLSSGHILASNQSGDLTVFHPHEGSRQHLLLPPSVIAHFRIVFTAQRLRHDYVITTSMDRNVIVWKVKSDKPVEQSKEPRTPDVDDDDWRSTSRFKPSESRTCTARVAGSLNTFGGYVYSIRASPLDSGRLAIGVGDNLIRLWNTNEGMDGETVVTLWQGLQNKVTSVAWHPSNETWLAYGTDDGRVGLFKSLQRKPPLVSSTYHRKVVYVVIWGPPLLSTDTTVSCIYSIGDGTVLVHNMATMSDPEPARDLNQALSQVHGPALVTRVRSELGWSPGYLHLLLCSDDGSILMLCRNTLKLICTIKVCNKLINAIRLQPNADKSNQLAAIASNEHQLRIVDITTALASDSAAAGDAPSLITDPVMTLKGHKSRVTDACWSHFDNSTLVSVSYDMKSIVWSVRTGEQLSVYATQHGHILTCQWSLVNPDLIYTGSDDFSLHAWSPSRHVKRVKAPAQPLMTETKTEPVTEAEPSAGVSSQPAPRAPPDSLSDLKVLLAAKKRELLASSAEEDNSIQVHDESRRKSREDNSHLMNGSVLTTGGQELDFEFEKKPTEGRNIDQRNRLRRRTARSYFPNLTACATPNDREAELSNLLYMQQCIQEKRAMVKPGKEHLGIFSLLDEDFEEFVAQEETTLLAAGGIEQVCQHKIWQGEVEVALSLAVQHNVLNDTLVNSASMVSHSLWMKYCKLYAQQLKTEGAIHKAALFLLYTHETQTAINWLVDAGQYREALCIARSRFKPDSPVIRKLYEKWIIQLKKDANYEPLIKCLLALGDERGVLEVLEKRTDIESVARALQFALSSTQCQDSLPMLCERLTKDCLLAGRYEVLESVCKPHQLLQPYLCWSLVHQKLRPALLPVSKLDKTLPMLSEHIEKPTKETPAVASEPETQALHIVTSHLQTVEIPEHPVWESLSNYLVSNGILLEHLVFPGENLHQQYIRIEQACVHVCRTLTTLCAPTVMLSQRLQETTQCLLSLIFLRNDPFSGVSLTLNSQMVLYLYGQGFANLIPESPNDEWFPAILVYAWASLARLQSMPIPDFSSNDAPGEDSLISITIYLEKMLNVLPNLTQRQSKLPLDKVMEVVSSDYGSSNHLEIQFNDIFDWTTVSATVKQLCRIYYETLQILNSLSQQSSLLNQTAKDLVMTTLKAMIVTKI